MSDAAAATITVNGEARAISPPATIRDVLADLGFGGIPVLVEHNGSAIFPRNFGDTDIHDGDCLEVIRIVAGG